MRDFRSALSLNQSALLKLIYFSFFSSQPTCPHAASSLAPLLSLSIVAAADRRQVQSPVTYDLAGVSPSATSSRERSRKASPPFGFAPRRGRPPCSAATAPLS